MKNTILLVALSIVLVQCGEQTNSPEAGSAWQAPTRTVELSDELNAELKKIGFVMPAQKVDAPDFSLVDLAGKTQSLSSFRGKLVFLNFWGVWCYYCKVEMPSIQRLYDRLREKGFEVVAVNVRDTEQTAREFIRSNNHTFPVLLDKEYTATSMYGIRGFPTTFIVDRQGGLRAMYVGTRQWDENAVVTLFEKLLNEPEY